MAKPLTSWLVPSFLQHNLPLVVSGRCLHILVTKFQDKFTSLRKQIAPIAEKCFKYYIRCTNNDKISTKFCSVLRGFVNFAALRPRKISEALTMSCVIYVIQTGH